MKHFPARVYCVAPLPLEHTRAPRLVRLKTAMLVAATLFAAGFAIAVWTIGMIVTRR